MGDLRHQPKTQRDYNAAIREQQVLQLRTQGMEFDAIARQVGYTDRGAAYKAYKRALARIPKPQAEEEIQNQLMRLNAAIKALWTKIQAGDTWAIEKMVALEDRRAKLLGLDAKGDGPPAGQVIIREYGVDLSQV